MRILSYAVTLAMVVSLLAGSFVLADESSGKGEAKAVPISLDYIHAEFSIAVIFNPPRIQQMPQFDAIKDLIGEENLNKFREDVHFDHLKLSHFIFLAGTPPKNTEHTEENEGLILRFEDPVDQNTLRKSLLRESEKAEHKGNAYFRMERHGRMQGVYFVDARTVLYAPERSLQLMMTAKKVDTPLTKLLAKVNTNKDIVVVAAIEPLREEAKKLEEYAQRNAPPQIAKLISMADTIDSAVAEFDFSGKELLHVTVECADETTSTEIEKLAADSIEMFKTLYGFMIVPQAKQNLPPQVAQPLLDVGQSLLDGAKVARHGTTASLSLQRPQGVEALPKLLAPILSRIKKNANRANRMNNLRQIAMAMMMYSVHKENYPAAYRKNKQGKPLLSWRVQLLPYFGQEELYKEFKQDEPWDSPQNQKLIERMPPVYGDSAQGNTRVQVFVGEAALFHEDRKSDSEASTDGSQQTILLVETGPDKAVPWTKPVDVAFDPKDPIKALGDISDEGFLAAFCNSSVELIAKDIDPKALKAMVTPAGKD